MIIFRIRFGVNALGSRSGNEYYRIPALGNLCSSTDDVIVIVGSQDNTQVKMYKPKSRNSGSSSSESDEMDPETNDRLPWLIERKRGRLLKAPKRL